MKKLPNAALILVPRHPERFDAVSQLVANEGFCFSRRTSMDHLGAIQVYIGDTMGDMLTLMQAADICFMGGSLIGNKVGGHNLLEPTVIGIPSLIGPSFYNFKGITERLIAIGLTEVANENELASKIHLHFSSKSHDFLGLSREFILKNNSTSSYINLLNI